VLVVRLSPRDSYTGDALTYPRLYIAERLEAAFPATPEAMVMLAQGFADCAAIVDAILGTGMQGRVREPATSVIAAGPPGSRRRRRFAVQA
jgi:NAD(P)H-hydrate repair Nnr-like enzyme with NAD(P)H-hydrate epimerase domain